MNSVRLISKNPEKIRALEEMGLKLVERVSVVIPTTDAAKGYLRTKKEKMGHLLVRVKIAAGTQVETLVFARDNTVATTN